MRFGAMVNPIYVWERIQFHGPKRLLIKPLKNHPRASVAARKLIQLALIFAHPFEYWERSELARKMLAGSSWRGTVPSTDGYAFIERGRIPGAESVLKSCQDVYAAWSAANKASSTSQLNYIELLEKKNPEAGRSLIADLNDHSVIQQFVLGRDMVEIAADYLGEIPVIATVQLTLTAPNSSRIGPQKFHLDYGANRELQLFMSITDVDEQTGPLSFFPANLCEGKLDSEIVFANGRLEDDEVYAMIRRDELVRGISKAGTCLFIDTRRCAHFGSRGNVKPRVVLIIKYITRFSSSDHNNALGRIRFNRGKIGERYQQLVAAV